MLINKRQGVGLKIYNDSKAFNDYSNDIDGIHENIEEYNPHKEHEVLIVFQTNIRLIFPQNFVMEIPNKQEPQQTSFNH